jgi:hypothetical protein
MPASRRSRNPRSPRTRRRQKNARNKAAAEQAAAEQAAVQTFLQKQNLLRELRFDLQYAHTYRMGEQYGVRAGLGVRDGGVERAWQDYCQIASSADQTENAKLVFFDAFERGFDSGKYERQDGEY